MAIIQCYLSAGKEIIHNKIIYKGYYLNLCYHLCYFYKVLVTSAQMKRYSRHSMLSFPLFQAVTSLYYYLLMKYKQPTFYVSSSCFSQFSNSPIKSIKILRKYPSFYVSLPLGKQKFKILEFASDILDNYVITFVILKLYGS